MDPKSLQLGSKVATMKLVGEEHSVTKDDQRINTMEHQLKDLGVMVGKLFKMVNANAPSPSDSTSFNQENIINKDGIPINSTIVGMHNGTPYIAYVVADGYTLGSTKYSSLSAMARFITGKRRNGWDFWKTMDDRTVGEVYKQ